jgi:hypothetical protein
MSRSLLLQHTRRVTLQLSNLCNYSGIHDRCPVHTFETVEILPRRIINNVLDDLAVMEFAGEICYHVYNEPGIDPRLSAIIQQTARVAGLRPHLWTNGWYLTDVLARELIDCGLQILTVSAYGQENLDRLAWVTALPIETHLSKARLLESVMRREGSPERWRPCYAPLCDITVRASGHVGICCLDYAEELRLGDLNEWSFARWLDEEFEGLARLRDDLASRRRAYPVCQRCERRRR